MNPFPFLLLLAALVLLCLAGFNVPARRVTYGWLGMACWCLAILLGYLPALLHTR
jgi:hypothetical protein